MRFSKRTEWVTAPNPLAQLLVSMRAQGIPILDLTESNPTRCSFNYLKPDILRALDHPDNLVYEPDPQGLPEAREAVCRYYAQRDICVTPEQIFLTAGTSEAYTFLFRLLLDAGEAALTPRPSYPLFDYLSQLNDVVLWQYALAYDEGWRLDGGTLTPSLAKGAKALVWVNPNNPTGNFLKKDEKEMLNKFCHERDLAVIADEVFYDFCLEAKKTQKVSFAGNTEVLTFTLGGVSKTLGLPQMKVSWMVVSGPPDLKKKAIERLAIIADTTLSVNTPSQRALAAWLSMAPEIQAEIMARVRVNRRVVEEASARSRNAKVLACEGGWAAVIAVDTKRTDEELALQWLKECQVHVYPGYFFDFNAENFLVVSLLPKPGVFKEGIDRVLDAVI